MVADQVSFVEIRIRAGRLIVRKRSLVTAVVLLMIALLLSREFHHWHSLQWSVFRAQIGHVKWPNIFLALLFFLYLFFVRAWRWKLFLASTHPTTTIRMLGPTFIGFTALALIGGPGEFTRPYLIAKKEDITVSSQMAVWMVERIFDMGGFTLLFLLAAFFANLDSIPYVQELRRIGLVLAVILTAAVAIMIQLERHRGRLENIVAKRLVRVTPQFACGVSKSVGAFSAGLRTLSETKNLFQQSALSLVMWAVIALAYHEVIHAFPPPLETMTLAVAPIVLAFAIFGGLLQLPAGATSQLMVIFALLNVFHVPTELAVSCGIALWLGAYIAPVPVGLLYLRSEHLSFLGIVTPNLRAATDSIVSARGSPDFVAQDLLAYPCSHFFVRQEFALFSNAEDRGNDLAKCDRG